MATDPTATAACYRWPRECEHHDDLDCHIAESMKDPEFAAAYIEAGRRYGRDVARKLPSDETLRRAVDHLTTLLDKP